MPGNCFTVRMSTPLENPYVATPQLSVGDEKLWATIIHVAGSVSGIFAAWAGYLIFRNRGPFVRDNTRNALNWQISFTIYYVAGYLLCLVFIGFLVILAALVLNIVFSIQAAIAANRGTLYHYPLSIQFIKAPIYLAPPAPPAPPVV
jgi:uncharacterized Tic20 family protein